MFKSGDKVIVVKNNSLSGAFKIGEKYTIRNVNNHFQYQIVQLLEKGSSYYESDCFKLDDIYLRKDKINKIKERLNAIK